MNDEDLCFKSATELTSLYSSKQLSPVEVTESVLQRIERLEPTLNAFATLTAQSALEAAKLAEHAYMHGEEVGPLAGIPVTIKDLTWTAGVPTQFGSRVMQGNVPTTDAPLVTRLKESGAVILGKTTTPEFGWKGVSQSPLTGITSNPWRVGYNAGASSAGAGVGAAAGYGPLHQGSDGAGSIRMPSHFCGIFGLKPTFGRIPNWPVPNNDLTSHAGPMTRTVADAALMLRTLAGPHTWDHLSLESPPADYPAYLQSDLKGLRVAFSPNLGHARVDPEVATLVETAVAAFTDLGCEIQELNPGFGPEGPELVRFFWSVHELNQAHHLPAWESQMDPGLVACIRSGEHHTALDYLNMRRRKLAYTEQIHRFFETRDLLLTPSVSVAAFPAERLQPEHWDQHPWDWLQWAEFSYPFNMSGNPAASIPCGFTSDGLPVGLQIVGPRFADLTVLQAAYAFEQVRPWAHRRPDLSSDH